CPALLYLAAAGVGTIGIADGDTVSLSNLNRQTLFGVGDLEKLKAETAAAVLSKKYEDIEFEVIPHYLTSENALEIIRTYDLVLDGSDNFGTRYMINDACVLLKKPLIMGAIYQFEGQLAVFNYGPNPINYRDIYPDSPQADEIPNCSETGVLGVLPGIIGTLQAAEAIKVLSGLGDVLTNKILLYNFKICSFDEVQVKPNPSSGKNIPENEEAFRKTDYNITCGLIENISWDNAFNCSWDLENSKLIDIRELHEEPRYERDGIEKIPMGELLENPGQLEGVEHIMLFCKSGRRSIKVAQQLRKTFPEKNIYSVKGGILDPSS